MMPRRTVRDTPTTPHFNFIFGSYQLSQWRIPYFSTSMSLAEAADNLRLPSDFPGAERIQWRLDELYQREIDWPRVERSIVPYLNAEGQPQFFNSLTIALLPLRSSGDLRESFSAEATSDGGWQPPALDDPSRFEKVLNIGPVTCGYWEDWATTDDAEARTGQLRWNTEQVFSVALDGQHRLAAIQQIRRDRPVSADSVRNTRIPVILLILDRELGYEAPEDATLLTVLRTLFVDLNKHAKTVSRARQILLDDHDPTSVCVRALIGDVLRDSTDELEESPPRLPLALVDWHTEQAKFDDGPYLATVLGLDWAVSQMLGAQPISDYMRYSAIRGQINSISKALGVDLSTALERLNDLAKLQLRPFSYSVDPDNNEIQSIVDAFRAVWAEPAVELFTDFVPYRELIRLRERLTAIGLDFSHWYNLYERQQRDQYGGRATDEYKRFVNALMNRPGDQALGEKELKDKLDEIEHVKDRYNLAFKVVFQRALVLALGEYQKIEVIHLDELIEEEEEDLDFEDDDFEYGEEAEEEAGEEEDQEQPEQVELWNATTRRAELVKTRASEFVATMNALIDTAPTVLEVDHPFETEEGQQERFWLGTLRRPDEDIDFTQGASGRASELLFWAASISLYYKVTTEPESPEFDAFWAEMNDGASSFMRRLERSVHRFSKRESSAGGRILRARDEDFNEDASGEEARKRMAWLWDQLAIR